MWSMVFLQFNILLTFCDYQVEESDEARRKFSNAKSISSAQYFGDASKANDMDSQVSLQKFSVCILCLTDLIEIFQLYCCCCCLCLINKFFTPCNFLWEWILMYYCFMQVCISFLFFPIGFSSIRAWGLSVYRWCNFWRITKGNLIASLLFNLFHGDLFLNEICWGHDIGTQCGPT